MTNFVNYLVAIRPSKDVEELPEERVEVDKWLEGIDAQSSLTSGGRQFWDDADTKTLQKVFKKFEKCPSKGVMREMFFKDELLAPICEKEGFNRCYEKVKSLMRRLPNCA